MNDVYNIIMLLAIYVESRDRVVFIKIYWLHSYIIWQH